MDERPQSDRFERLLTTLDGLPDVRQTKATTVMQTVPIIKSVTTAVVQTLRSEEDGFLIFLQVTDGSGGLTRLVLPDKVASVIYRQRAALTDRSTPESRRRAKVKRERELRREEKAERSRIWREKHPDGGPLAKARRKR